MRIKIFLNSILAIALAITQIGFVSGLPGWLKYADPCLIALVLILVVSNLKTAAAWSVGIGVLIDFFSFGFFGIHTAALFITITIIDLILVNLLTNRSLYSVLALVSAAYLIHAAVFYSLSCLADSWARGNLEIVFNSGFFLDKAAAFAINVILAIPAFYLVNIFSKQFKLSILKSRY